MDKEVIRKYLTSKIIDKIVGYIIEEQNCDIITAMNIVYSSPVMLWLQDKETDLYIQSPAYIYELMKKKLKTIVRQYLFCHNIQPR